MLNKFLKGSFLAALLFNVNTVLAANYDIDDFSALKTCVEEENVCKLTQDITMSKSLSINKNVTIDLNGHTLSGNIGGNGSIIDINATKLTINDSKNSGTIVNTSTSGYCISASNNGTAVINGGHLKSQYAPLAGNNTTGDMNFIVNGGTIEALEGAAIYMPGQVSLEINDGILKGGINLRMGQVTINGGKIINDNSKNVDSIQDYYNYSGNVWFSDAIAVLAGTYTSENTKYGNSLNLTINGGTIESTVGNGISIYALGKVKQDMNIKINGGTIKGKTTAYTVETPAMLNITDEAYTKVVNDPVTLIAKGTFNSDVTKYLSATSKIAKDDNLYVVSENKTVAPSKDNDIDATLESSTAIDTSYILNVTEDNKVVNSGIEKEAKNLINDVLAESNTTIKDYQVLATYDISVLDENNQVVKMENGNFKISLNLGTELLSKFKNFKVVYIDDNGKVKEVIDAVASAGKITFETSHLSVYSIVGYNTEKLTSVENPKTADNIELFVILTVISLVSLVFATIKIKKLV